MEKIQTSCPRGFSKGLISKEITERTENGSKKTKIIMRRCIDNFEFDRF